MIEEFKKKTTEIQVNFFIKLLLSFNFLYFLSFSGGNQRKKERNKKTKMLKDFSYIKDDKKIIDYFQLNLNKI